MKRVLGIVLGVLWAVLAGLAFRESSNGWAAGHSDLGFWWAVIGTLLSIAGLGILVGSWIHTRPAED